MLPDTSEKFDGILADLGVSSHQFDDESRGFSFREGAPLDMRMSDSSDETAADVLNTADEQELARIFRDYGDEPRARRIASEVVRRRKNREFRTSDDLVGAIRAVLGSRSGASEFARIFQAVRIAVNEEMESLASALPALRDRLEDNGILAVIHITPGKTGRSSTRCANGRSIVSVRRSNQCARAEAALSARSSLARQSPRVMRRSSATLARAAPGFARGEERSEAGPLVDCRRPHHCSSLFRRR